MLCTAKLHGVRWSCGLALATALTLLPPGVFADEHPSEHPKEHPKGQTKSSGLTREALAKAIKGYVEKEAKLKGGYFLVYDQAARKPLALTLDRVHDDRLSRVSEGVYFACADFRTPENQVYDLDIFMKQSGSGLEVTEIAVHKEDGKARYGWVEKDGIWSKKGM